MTLLGTAASLCCGAVKQGIPSSLRPRSNTALYSVEGSRECCGTGTVSFALAEPEKEP
jgi:hypothetical protein